MARACTIGLDSRAGAVHRRNRILKGKMELAANSMRTVLIADDDTALNHSWQELLSDAGFDVLSCTTGQEAVDTIRQGRKVDVLLLDYSMPVLDGAQTLEQ